MKNKTNIDSQKNYLIDSYIGLRFDLSTCKTKDLISLIEEKDIELRALLLKNNRLPYQDWFIKGLNEQLETLNDELNIRKDIEDWINDGNVIKLSNNCFIEHTTQWKKQFTEIDLIRFYKREFLNL